MNKIINVHLDHFNNKALRHLEKKVKIHNASKLKITTTYLSITIYLNQNLIK